MCMGNQVVSKGATICSTGTVEGKYEQMLYDKSMVGNSNRVEAKRKIVQQKYDRQQWKQSVWAIRW